jgi:DegV family protein with EDD domain
MAVRFIADSGCDILPSEAEKLGILHLPLKVLFGEKEYLDAVDLSHREFYEKLVESDQLPTTCQVPPAEFAGAYETVVAAGDTAVVVTVSGSLSGTYQSAVIAAEDYEGKVFVVDSENVSLGQRILIQQGLRYRDAGLSAREIAERLEQEKKQIRVLALLDTLEYLKKGGRISAATALAGSLLSIKPVVTVDEGAVVMAGKARGSKQGNNLLRVLVEKSGGIDFSRPLCLAYSGLSDAMLRKYIEDSEELWQGHDDCLQIATVGCAIGTHAGPGAVAVAFFVNSNS